MIVSSKYTVVYILIVAPLHDSRSDAVAKVTQLNLVWAFSVLAERLTGKSISEKTYFVLSRDENFNSFQ